MKTKVPSSTALAFSVTLSPVSPNWVRMKAGLLSSLTTRSNDQATSSAVLYGLSLLCIIVGAVRSSRLVRRTITRGQHKLEV